MHLIELGENSVSLELDIDVYSDALKALSRFGAVTVEQCASYDLVAVGPHEFIATEEWEGTALISKDKSGSDILRSIAESFEARISQSPRRAA